MSPLSISVYTSSKILDIIQVFIAYKLQLQAGVNTTKGSTNEQVPHVKQLIKHLVQSNCT